MGIIRFIFDAGVITTAASGLRRIAGVSMKDMLLARVQNQYATKVITVYFNAGETLCDKCIGVYNSAFNGTSPSQSSKSPTLTSEKTIKKD